MTLKEATVVDIEIENRDVTVDVVAPLEPQMGALFNKLPEAMQEEHITGGDLTVNETADATHEIVDFCTDLPRDLIEQLPTSAMEPLVDAAGTVIKQQVEMWERNSARNDYDIDHTEVEFEFVAEDSGLGE